MEKIKLTAEQEMLYLRSMSIFLHEMRTSINGNIVNSVNILKQRTKDDKCLNALSSAVNRLFALCDLIPILEKIMLGTQIESIQNSLLRTRFFNKDVFSYSVIEILKQVASEYSSPTNILCEGNHNEKLLSKEGLNGTQNLYEVVFSHMINVLRETSRKAHYDGAIDITVNLKGKSLQLSAAKLREGKGEEFSIQNPFYLFQLIFKYTQLGELNFREQGDLNIVELICY